MSQITSRHHVAARDRVIFQLFVLQDDATAMLPVANPEFYTTTRSFQASFAGETTCPQCIIARHHIYRACQVTLEGVV